MPPPGKSSKPIQGGKDSEGSDTPSNNLWVGNLSTSVTDAELMILFSKHGAVDTITSYASRGYAFVYYKRVEDAKAAITALRGTVLRGNPLKIEFAKPAKPCKSLWVSGISPSVTKETLEEEFLKFGKIEEFKFLRERNTAYIDYYRLEDALQALKSMNGRRIGSDQIRVDFLRSHTSRREHWPDYRDGREGQFLSRNIDSPWMPPDLMRNYSDSIYSGSRRQQSPGGRKADGPPSKILQIGYPPSSLIDEQMLHNAMILFGEIESIKSFPSRNYAFVEFRSVDEARRAKEGLQGRLFNDPRISIMYSSSELTPGRDHSGFYPGIKGPRPDVFPNESMFQPAPLDLFGHSHPMIPSALSGPSQSSGILGPHMSVRPFSSKGSLEPVLSGPELNESAAVDSSTLVGGSNWRRSSPAPGLLPSPPMGMKRPTRPGSGWDVYDANQLQRESKRSRIDDVLPGHESPFASKKMDGTGMGLKKFYGLGPPIEGGASGPLSNVQEKNRFSPAEVGIRTGGPSQGYVDQDYIWHGVIAKGGSPVCCARCVPVGKGIESDFPKVVNCSARTGLDMLTKHYADAIGFDIVFFLPDSEEDFASYTDFLRYLGAKNRAGVAKFDDGTTLFLVPPSDFLTKVLNIVGPERLYGVVLKFPHVPSSTSLQPLPSESQYGDDRQIPSRKEYTVNPPREEEVLPVDYVRVPQAGTMPSQKQLVPSSTDSHSAQPVPLAASQAGVTLTPELIATLASLIPATVKSSSVENIQSSISSVRPSFAPTASEMVQTESQGWPQELPVPEQMGYPLQQVESQFYSQGQSQVQGFPTGSNMPSHPAIGVMGGTHFLDPAFNVSQEGTISSRPLTNFTVASQSGHLGVSAQVDQRYHYEVSQNDQKGFGIAHGTDSLGLYGQSLYQQNPNSAAFSNTIYQPQNIMPPAAETVKPELPNQVQQLQSTFYGAGQGTSDVEVDKNQRYQSTLQFAANILLQLQQQQQQQTGTQAGQGPPNH